MERLLRATINSWRGLLAAARSEEAFRLELIALVLAIPVAFLLAEQAWKRLALIAVMAFVLVVELLNTAIEKLADRVNLTIDPQIGRVKDMGSAAVGPASGIASADPPPPWLPKTCFFVSNSAFSSSVRSGRDEPPIRSVSPLPGSPAGSIGGTPSSWLNPTP